MNTFKKKSLHAAVLAGLGAIGAAGTAEAVHINPDGLGQVLIYPYYTARTVGGSAQNTLISVVNTTSQFKVVKVRFLEGKASREVLDFNLFLSPQDVWTGVVAPTADGARIATNDNSCVAPSDLFTRTPGVLEAFKNFQYTGTPYSLAGVSLDRTREGYFEVLEMGVVTTAQVQGYIKHGTNGIPANCGALDAMDPGSGNVANIFPGTFLTAPTGGLAGRASVLNASTGANYTYDAVAIDQWTAAVQYTEAGNTAPSLGSGGSTVSNVFVNGGVISATWAAGPDSVSATMMRDTVMNEFVLDSATASLTDWVLTFPTKRDYVTAAANPPFSNGFGSAGSCDPYGVSVFDREERSTTAAPNVILPSPRPPTSTPVGANVCWESTVVPFGASSLLGSTNTSALTSDVAAFVAAANSTAGTRTSVAAGTVQGANGWFLMSFQTRARQRLVPASATLNGVAIAGVGGASVQIDPVSMMPLVIGAHYGLPVVGSMFHNYNRSGVVSTYGGVITHKFTRLIPTT